MKAVSLPSFLSQLDSLSSPRNRVGEREMGDRSILMTFCLKWIFVLSYLYCCEKRNQSNRKDKTYFGLVSF